MTNEDSAWRLALCAPSKLFYLGKLRQESQLALQEKKKKANFSVQFTTMSIQKTPLPRKLLIFTVSAHFFFANCIFMIPCSVLGTFYTQEKSLSFLQSGEIVSSNHLQWTI